MAQIVRGALKECLMKDLTIDELWRTVPPAKGVFELESILPLPATAQRYLRHAIQPGTTMWSAVRLKMHGSIRLNDAWLPFTGEQVNRWDRGFVWRAKVTMNHLPITGSDRWIDGEAEMRWKLLGIIPIMSARSVDVTRSAAGRLNIEAMMMPTVWLGSDVRWNEYNATQAQALIRAHGEDSLVDIAVDGVGAPHSFSASRWGNPAGSAFHYEDFGGLIEEERTWCGVTIPSKLRLGWFCGTPRFDLPGGEFFRVTVDSAEFK